MFKKSLLALAVTFSPIALADTAPTNAELWKIIQTQQAELDELKSKLEKMLRRPGEIAPFQS